MNIFKRVSSKLGRAFLKPHSFDYGKVYGSYGISEEVDLATSTISTIRKTIDIEIVILDVGANIGEYASLLSSRISECVKLHCFEPSADHFDSLKLLELQHKNRVFFHSQACSNLSGRIILYKDQKGSGLASVYNRDLTCHGLALDLQEEIEATTIDDFMRSTQLPEITFLKVDVEGHELDVFRGAKDALSTGKIHAIQFEFGGCNIDSRTYVKDFHRLLVGDYNYKFFRLASSRVLVDLNTYHEGLECFLWQNFVAFRLPSFIPPDYSIVYE